MTPDELNNKQDELLQKLKEIHAVAQENIDQIQSILSEINRIAERHDQIWKAYTARKDQVGKELGRSREIREELENISRVIREKGI